MHKAITIFTLLFGISFVLQLERAPHRTPLSFDRFYLRRLLVLLTIGVLHGLLWFGDVLRYYAIAGAFLLLIWRLRPAIIGSIGIVIALFPWNAIWQITEPLRQGLAPPEQMLATTFSSFTGPDFVEMIKANVSYDLWFRRTEWAFPLAILGRILLGAALAKSEALRRPQDHLHFWRVVAGILLPFGVALTVLTLKAPERVGFFSQTLRGAASLSMGFGYIAVFILLFFSTTRIQQWMRSLCAVGRATLTSYLLQTVLSIGLFYGVGLAIGPRFGLSGVLVFWLLIFSTEIFAARWWFARFRFGPVEWIWRCLSYGSMIPLRTNS